MKISRRIAAGLILPFCLAIDDAPRAQQLADYEFIDWSVGDLVIEPTPPDPEAVASLTAGQDSYAYRLVEVELNFSANGDIEQFQRVIVDYADAAGIEAEGNASVYVNSFSDQLRIEEAYVTMADGNVMPVVPASVQVLLEDDRGVFSNDHQLIIPWPSLVPGAASTLSYRLTTDGDRLAAPWSRLLFPQVFVPTRQFDLLVTWEDGAEAPLLESDLPDLDCRRSGNSIRCAASDMGPVHTDFDVNYFDELGHIVVAEPASWGDIVQLLRAYIADSWTENDRVAAVVEEVIAGADTDLDKLEAIHSFVSEQVRYVGIETGVNGVVPRDTGLTLSRRYGDCKDKTALFLHMADIAGLSAFPVIVSSHRKNLDKLIAPSLSYFDHMVACIDLDDRSLCIDLTDPYSPTIAPPSYLQQAAALQLTEGNLDISQMEALPFTWALEVLAQNRFDGGTVHEAERRIYGPTYSGRMRASLAGLNRTERERWARDRYEEVYGTDTPIETDIQGLSTQQQPFIVESRASFENAILVDQPLLYEHYPGWLVDLASQFYSNNEYFDYRLSGFAYRGRTTFAIDGWAFAAPGAEIEFRSEFGTMERWYRYEDGTLYVQTTLEVPARTIALDDIERFNNFLDAVIDNSIIRFRARPKP